MLYNGEKKRERGRFQYENQLATLWNEIHGCEKCGLCATRTLVVPGEGNPHAKLMFIGEGPGREEDLQGRPFVGPAGQLLDKMIAAIDMRREDVYICNVVKCRPPGNRVPEENEALSCLPYLRAQFVLVQPKVIVCLGATAAGMSMTKMCASRGTGGSGGRARASGSCPPTIPPLSCGTP